MYIIYMYIHTYRLIDVCVSVCLRVCVCINLSMYVQVKVQNFWVTTSIPFWRVA